MYERNTSPLGERILFLVETWNPKTLEIETLIFWSGLTEKEIKTHAGDHLCIITAVYRLTSNKVKT